MTDNVVRRVGLAIAAALLVAGLFLARSPIGAQGPSIGGYQLVSEQRVTRTQYDYTFRAVLTNAGPPPLQGATARVASQTAATMVLDAELTFGPVAAGGSATSLDTFTIRHDRTVALNLDALVWAVTPTAANQAPIAVIAPPAAIFVSQPVALDGRGSSDPENDPLTFAWSLVSRPPGSSAAIANATSAQASFLPDRAGTYVVRLDVQDGHSTGSAQLSLDTSNSPPRANAGPDQTVALHSLVTLDGSGSSDVDGQPLTYQWTFVATPVGSSAALSDATAVRPTFSVDRPGSYTIRLIVHDGLIASQADLVIVGTSNSPPVANAGPDRTVARGAVVTLDASGSSDVDGDPLTYLWEFVSVPPGSVAILSDATALQPTFTADRRGDFVVRLTVRDGQASHQDTIVITTENTRPVANAGADRTAPLGAVVTLDGGGSTDVDGDALTYQWSLVRVPPGSAAALSSVSAVSPAFTVDRAGEYIAQLIVHDGNSASEPDTVTIATENSRPIAEAGPNQSVAAGAVVALDGSGSSDPDQDTLRYAWSLTSVPPGSAAALNDPALAAPAFVADRPGTYIAQLIVDDGHLTSAPDTVTITTSNSAPIADAGPDRLDVPLGTLVTLDGTASRDPDGHALTFAWALLSVPEDSAATLVAPSTATPAFVADVAGSYIAQLIVRDPFVPSAPDTVTVRVVAGNRPPIAAAGADRTVTTGALVTLDGSGSNDPDHDALTYRWTLAVRPPQSAAALQGAASSAPTFTADRAGTYTIELIVNDGTVDSAPDRVTIVATDPTGAPTITGFSPTSGRAGTLVSIAGTNFVDVQSVAFNGVPAATMVVVSPTTLSVAVPDAATTGPIAVTTPAGSAVSTGHFVVLERESFELRVVPSVITVPAGGQGLFQVSVDGSSGFSNLATLGIGALPAGATAAFGAPTLTAGQSTTLTIRTAGVPAGNIPLTVSATAVVDGADRTRTAAVTVAVAAAGMTTVAGQFRTVADVPIPNVLLQIGAVSAHTDAAGNFVLQNVPSGPQSLMVNAHVAVAGYPIYQVDITVPANQTLVLPTFFVTPPPPADRFTALDNASQPQVITDARYPGVEITLPQGVTITGWDGTRKTKMAVERLRPDKLPVPPPPGPAKSVYQIYFGTPMGGVPSAKLPVTLPNESGLDPGQKAELWWFDASPLGGRGEWRMAGLGTVSGDGLKIVSDPGVGIDRFCGACGMPCFIPRQDVQGNNRRLYGGDPVELSLGQMIVDKTDLILPGRVPAVVHRTFNPLDPFGRVAGFEYSLGPGWALSIDVALMEISPSLRRLVLPGNTRLEFARQPDGTFVDQTDALFAGAVLTSEGSGVHRLRMRDGSGWRFAPTFLAGLDLLVEQTDSNGNRLTIDRDTRGTVTRITEPSGRRLTFTSAGGLITEVQDPAGRTVRYGYSGGRLQTVTDAAGGTTRYAYDTTGRIVTVTDAKGVDFIRNEYSPLSGRILRQIEADGSEWQFRYKVLPRATQQLPNTLNPVAVEESLASVAAGLSGDLRDAPMATTVVNPRGQATTYTLQAGRATAITDTLGQTTRLDRDARGQITQATDPLGRTTRFAYDAAGNVTRITDPQGHATAFGYEPLFHKVTMVTDALGQVTTFEYDAKGNLTAIVDPEQNARPAGERLKTRIAYDAFGQAISTTDPLGQVSTLTYDDRGDLVAAADPQGNTSRLLYDAVSRVTSQIDPRGRSTSFSYDALNQLTAIVDAMGGETGFDYDANGNLLALTDARGHTVRYEYDTRDRVTRRIDQLQREETFAYDANGNLTSATDRKGQTSRFTYDGLDRQVLSEFADGASVRFRYDAASRLVQADDSADPHRPIALAYDTLDRLAAETTALGTVHYTYDPLGRRTQMLASGAEPVTYGYDRSSRLRSVTQAPMAPAMFEYDAADRRTRLTLPNGVSTDYGYDTASRLTELVYRNALGALGNLTYTYDASGRRTGVGGTFARTLLPDPVAGATYDAANQQVQFGDRQMAYDANGNLVSMAVGGRETQFVWDARNRLTSYSGLSALARFAFDARGRRASKDVNGSLTRYIYDGVDFLSEASSDRTISYLRSLFVDEALVRGGTEHYLADALGSAVALTTSAGTVGSEYAYEPYGRTAVAGASDNSVQYTGREHDGGDLYYYRARFYAPALGRFVSEDPLGYGAGAGHLFNYANNSPAMHRDPSGKILPFLIPVLAAAGDALISTAIIVAASSTAIYLAKKHADFQAMAISDPESKAAEAQKAAAAALGEVGIRAAGLPSEVREVPKFLTETAADAAVPSPCKSQTTSVTNPDGSVTITSGMVCESTHVHPMLYVPPPAAPAARSLTPPRLGGRK